VGGEERPDGIGIFVSEKWMDSIVSALLELALDNDIVICNTLSQQKECRKWTHTTNMIRPNTD